MYYLIKNETLIEQSVSKSDLELVIEPGMIISDSWPIIGKKFENGEYRDKTESEMVIDNEINLNDRKSQLKSKIKSYLWKKLEDGVEFQNSNFQTREEDLVRMSLALKKIELGGKWSGYWRDSENRWREISAEQLAQLALVAGNYWENCFRKSRNMIDDIESNNNKTQLANYEIQIEWDKID